MSAYGSSKMHICTHFCTLTHSIHVCVCHLLDDVHFVTLRLVSRKEDTMKLLKNYHTVSLN